MFPSVEGIELVEQVELLGIMLQNNSSVNCHVNYVLTLCSQRIFLLKRLHDQGLNYGQLDLVFQAIIVSRILYTLPGWGRFLNKELTGRISAFYNKHIDVTLLPKFWRSTVYSIMQARIFSAICKGLTIVYLVHCILPVETPHDYKLHECRHNFVLPRCQSNIFKTLFFNGCFV